MSVTDPSAWKITRVMYKIEAIVLYIPPTKKGWRDFCGLCFFFCENLYIYPAL